eukprot:scaffold57728_cov31-Tisochrysis_lutea.AAC.1
MAVARAGEYESIRHCLQRTARAEGYRALYKGLPASLMGIVPFSAVDLCLFNTLKERISRRWRRDPDVLTLLGCGALSASVAQVRRESSGLEEAALPSPEKSAAPRYICPTLRPNLFLVGGHISSCVGQDEAPSCWHAGSPCSLHRVIRLLEADLA